MTFQPVKICFTAYEQSTGIKPISPTLFIVKANMAALFACILVNQKLRVGVPACLQSAAYRGARSI